MLADAGMMASGCHVLPFTNQSAQCMNRWPVADARCELMPGKRQDMTKIPCFLHAETVYGAELSLPMCSQAAFVGATARSAAQLEVWVLTFAL